MTHRWNDEALTRAEREAYSAAVVSGPVPPDTDPPAPTGAPEVPTFLHFWPGELPDYLGAVMSQAAH